jgi:hypothetical protein
VESVIRRLPNSLSRGGESTAGHVGVNGVREEKYKREHGGPRWDREAFLPQELSKLRLIHGKWEPGDSHP